MCTLCRALLDAVSRTIKCSVVLDWLWGSSGTTHVISETHCSPCFLLQYPQEKVDFSFPRGPVSHQSSPIPLCRRERKQRRCSAACPAHQACGDMLCQPKEERIYSISGPVCWHNPGQAADESVVCLPPAWPEHTNLQSPLL